MRIRTCLTLGLAGLAAGLVAFPFTFAAAQPPACGLSCIKAPETPTLLVNSRRIKLNYALEGVGPSGVSKIELWATRDGKSWARYSNEPPPGGPLSVQVTEEGKYGFAIVASNGVGVRSPEPKPGDAPQVWVVVDETKPVVKLHEAKACEGGTLAVHWSATDEHLMPSPVTVSVAKTREGPWTPVAANVENTGRFAWTLPKDHPYECFVRVEVMDRAGNVGCAVTATAVKADMMRPRGVIIGVDAEKTPMPITIHGGKKDEPQLFQLQAAGFSR